MKRMILTAMMVLGVLTGLGSQARAQQYYPPGYRPPGASLAPALNLVRNQNNPAILGLNYYLGTVPENVNRFNAQQFGTAILGLEGAVFASGGGEEYDESPDLLTTGHQTSFLNTGGFYPRPGLPNRRGGQQRRFVPGQGAQTSGGQTGTPLLSPGANTTRR